MKRPNSLVGLLALITVLTTGCANVAWFLISAATERHSEGEVLEFNQVNMRFVHPGRPYFTAPEKNDVATLQIMRLDPAIQFMVIAEEGEDLTVEAANLAQVALNNLKRAVQSYRTTDPEPVTLANQPGLKFTTEAKLKEGEILYVHGILVRNGFLYQLIAFGEVSEREAVLETAQEMFARFSLIDPERISSKVQARPYVAFDSSTFGYTMRPTANLFITWPEVAKEVEEAETGALARGGRAGFVVAPFAHGQPRPRMEALARAATVMMGFKVTDNDVVPSGPVTENGTPGQLEQLFTAARKTKEAKYEYRLKIVSTPEVAYFLWVWSANKSLSVDKVAEAAFPGFRVTSSVTAVNIPDALKKPHATHFNQCGLHHYDAKQYPQACPYFRRAMAMDPQATVFLTNSQGCLYHLKDHPQALALYDAATETQRQEVPVRVWHAWHLNAQGEQDKALAIFKELFAAGHHDDEDFGEYISILEAQHRHQEAMEAFEGYLALRPSLPMRMRQSSYLYRQKKHDEALAMLERVQKGSAMDAQIAYARMAHLFALERYKDVIAVTDQLVERGLDSADVQMWRGRAQYQLKWHRKAKESFERAVALAPGDADAKEWLQHISAELGEGNNSAIKEALAPVPLPPELARELVPLANPPQTDRGAYYDWRVDGVQFERGKLERITYYRRIRVLDESGVSRFSTLQFDFSPLAERIFVNSLVVTNAKGEVVSRGNVDDYYVIDQPDNPHASHDQTLVLPVPQVAPGHTLEFVVTKERRGLPEKLWFHDVPLSNTRPVGVAALFYVGDAKEVRTAAQNAPAATPTTTGLMFLMKDPPLLTEEPLAARYTQRHPMVYLGDARNDWKELGREYLTSLKEVLKEDAIITATARELTRNAKSPKEKLEILWQHVQKKITYRAVEFGVRALIPTPAGKTLENGYGDCKDHSVLLHQMLKAVSIPSSLVLVHTYADLQEGLPSLDQFNHMILLVGSGKEARFVDATDKEFGRTMLTPVGLAGRRALVLTEQPRFLDIPAYRPADSKVRVQRNVAFTADQVLDVNEEVQLTGYIANFTRAYLRKTDPAGQKTWLQGLVGRSVPGAQLQDVAVEKLDDNGAPLVLRARYRAGRGVDRQDQSVFITLPLSWEDYHLAPSPVSDRKSDYEIPYPLDMESVTHVTSSTGVKLAAAREVQHKASGPSAECSSAVADEAGGERVELRCTVRHGVYPAASYVQHQATMEQALKAASSSLRGTVVDGKR
ncbi:MAG: DUF3857 domain-containing protein [Myxococcota bacterium]